MGVHERSEWTPTASKFLCLRQDEKGGAMLKLSLRSETGEPGSANPKNNVVYFLRIRDRILVGVHERSEWTPTASKFLCEDMSCAKSIKLFLEGDEIKSYPDQDKITEKIEARKKSTFKFPDHYWKDLELALSRNSVTIVTEILVISKEIIEFKII